MCPFSLKKPCALIKWLLGSYPNEIPINEEKCLFTQMYVTTLFIIELILKEYECVNWKNII